MFKLKIAALIFLLSTSFVFAQKSVNITTGIDRDSLLTVAKEIIDSAQAKVLISVDEDGIPHARQMDPFAPEEDMVVWLATNPNTRKVMQIKNNPNVAIFYYFPKRHAYVTMNGKAELVNNPEMKNKYWKSYWTRYYPNKEKDMILIKVIPQRLELISIRNKLFWKDNTFMPQFVELNPAKIAPIMLKPK